ncbi:penicillin-binding protein [Deinococcus irradiatisoli]|uniref:Penicillin-binding protein n=1 Tax=Deinococcus irradiatisoli TaxID=2202254 RepID=A0A2Z3JGY2_9DEIO|nr:penicillin-binding protein [Deinococcus irradiatisoli]
MLSLLLALGSSGLGPAQGLVRLGDPLPPHPWSRSEGDDERELVVLYSHDCGDLGELWSAVLSAGLPVRAVNAEDVASPAPRGLSVWHGPDATAFARALKVSAYPTVLLVRGERVLNAWEGTFSGKL